MKKMIVSGVQILAMLGIAAAAAASAGSKISAPKIISVAEDGSGGRGFSVRPELTASGDRVAFISMADNLVLGSGEMMNIFVRELASSRMTLVSGDLGVSTDPAISGDGQLVAFASTAPRGVYSQARQILLAGSDGSSAGIASIGQDGDAADGDSATPVLSYDGSRIVYVSSASNLTSNCGGGYQNIYMRDTVRQETTCLSVTAEGGGADNSSYQPSISADGRYVAFRSSATNLVDGDTNGKDDIFLRDLTTGVTRRVSVSTEGLEANRESTEPSISANGDRIVFVSRATNLDPRQNLGSPGVYLHDTTSGETTLVSVDKSGRAAEGFNGQPRISDDGRFVVFLSSSTVLAGEQSNGRPKVFLRDMSTTDVHLISVGMDGEEANNNSFQPAISADGKVIAFRSAASNLVPGDNNWLDDIFYVTVDVDEVGVVALLEQCHRRSPMGSGQTGDLPLRLSFCRI